MSAAVVNIGNILLGNLKPRLVAPNQSKSVSTASEDPLDGVALKSENAIKPAKNAETFKKALKAEKPAQKIVKSAQNAQNHLATLNITVNPAELPQVPVKKSLTNASNIPASVNLKDMPPVTETKTTPKPVQITPNIQTRTQTQTQPSPQIVPTETTPDRTPSKIAAPAKNSPQPLAQVPDGKADTPRPQTLTSPQATATPKPEPSSRTPETNPAPKAEAPATKPVNPETPKPTPKNLQIQPPLPESSKTNPLTQNQPQATYNEAPPAPKTTTSTLESNPAPVAKAADTQNPEIEPPSKPETPPQTNPNPDEKPAIDPALEKAVNAQVRTTSAPKKPQDTRQPKADTNLDPARTQQIPTAAENQPHQVEQPTPPDSRPQPLPAADQQNIARQINESVTATIREGKNEVSVRLNPPELGRVSIKFEQADDGITARIEVARPQTRVEIEHALPDVLRGLASSGVQVKRLEVNLTENADTQNNRHQSLADQQNQWTHQQDSQSSTSQHQTRATQARWFTDAPAASFSDPSQPRLTASGSLNLLM